MDAVLTPQLVDVVDVDNKTRAYSSGTSEQLASCRALPWGLYVECTQPADPEVEREICLLLPADDLKLTVKRPRASRPHSTLPCCLTAVRIEHDGQGRHWRNTDLLLGLRIQPGSAPRLIQADEFAAAVVGGVVGPQDTGVAIRAVYRALRQLATHRYNLHSWLSGRGVTEYWP